jgi:hypothetical protein
MSVNSDDVIQQEYEGGRMRRPRARSVLKPKKPKVNKQALLRKRLMKHFGGFFSEMQDQEDPPMSSSMSPSSMSPPPISPQAGGRRPRRRANSPMRRAKSPVKKAPVRRRPRRLGGEGSVIQDMMNFSHNNIFEPSGTNNIIKSAGNFPQQSYNFGVNTLGQVGNLVSGGRKRRVVRAASPKRRPVRRAASPKRRPVRRVMVRPMFN